VKLNIEAIRAALSGHVAKPIGKYRYFSVLVPLIERDGELFVLYEVRAYDMDVQPGDVSFPGGAVEPGETPREAALRETCEELGVAASAIEVISELDYLVTYSNFTLYAFLGSIDAAALEAARRARRGSAAEVAETFLVPLRWLLANEPDVYVNRLVPDPAPDLPVGRVTPNGSGAPYRWRTAEAVVPVYNWPGEADSEGGRGSDPGEAAEAGRVIWGLTARITMAFVELLKKQIG